MPGQAFQRATAAEMGGTLEIRGVGRVGSLSLK